MSHKKLNWLKNSKKTPPINGPVKLPMLKKIPHKRFPEGNKALGVKSAIYEIPKEKVEPTNNPAIRNAAISAKLLFSNTAAALNEKAPPNNEKSTTFFLPIRSLNAPSGN